MSELSSLQATLATEHAAVHAYGVIGARTSRSASPTLFATVTAAYAQHRARRDVLARRIRDLGGEPVPAAVTYVLPVVPRTPAQAGRAGQRVETSCAQSYAALVAQTTSGVREWAVAALADAAVRGAALGAGPDPFPGAPELASR